MFVSPNQIRQKSKVPRVKSVPDQSDAVATFGTTGFFPRVRFTPLSVNYPFVAMSFTWMALNHSSIDPVRGGATVVPRISPHHGAPRG